MLKLGTCVLRVERKSYTGALYNHHSSKCYQAAKFPNFHWVLNISKLHFRYKAWDMNGLQFHLNCNEHNLLIVNLDLT